MALLTPETIELVARNADVIMALLGQLENKDSYDVKTDETNNVTNPCCCPQYLRFKFCLCDVNIYNYNSSCPSSPTPPAA